tara:strand:- start:109 stop:306 length:198 start_codon:yes stop_codon:yes gene_type:complete
MKKLLYYIMTLIEHGLGNEIIKVLKKEKELTVFDYVWINKSKIRVTSRHVHRLDLTAAFQRATSD